MSTDNCFVTNEWDTLKKVVVGSATSWGPTPSAEEAVDPKSREHILAGTYPTESDVQRELDAFVKILETHGVQVLRHDRPLLGRRIGMNHRMRSR